MARLRHEFDGFNDIQNPGAGVEFGGGGTVPGLGGPAVPTPDPAPVDRGRVDGGFTGGPAPAPTPGPDPDPDPQPGSGGTGNTEKPRERQPAVAPRPPAPDGGGSGDGGGGDATPARPRTPSPVAAMPPAPFTPMPDPLGRGSNLASPAVQMRNPSIYDQAPSGQLFGRAGGLLSGGLGVPGSTPDQMSGDEDLTSLILTLLEGR